MSALYNKDILRLAVSIPHQQRLADPDGSAEQRSPTCGSRVAVDVRLNDAQRVAAFGIDISACALGQASAAVLGAGVIGADRLELNQWRDAIDAMLRGEEYGGNAPAGAEVLAPARDHIGRHPAILLPFDAALAALDDALAKVDS